MKAGSRNMRILVVEDEKALADALGNGLSLQGYSVDVVYDGEAALCAVEVNSYDLVVLDLNLPKVNGTEVCRKLRTSGSSTGVLMLTASSGIDDRIKGLDTGADDYLVKPFHFPELLARIRAILRRQGEKRNVILRTGKLVVDPNTLKAFVGDSEVALTTKEFGILEYLMRNAGRVISQEELLEHVWNEDANLFTHAIKVHINNIRKKLTAAGGEGLISTIKSKGYLIV
jgi:DNA-binding response OmpR family regulator